MPASTLSAGQVLAGITNRMVQLHTRHYGKGPNRAKTYMVDDTVICMLKEGFTRAEQTLIAEGRTDAVHEVRRSFQAALQDEFTSVVEEATERRVIGYMSQVHVDPDVAVEIFLLEPAEAPDQPG